MILPLIQNIFIISFMCSGVAIFLLIVRKVIGKNTGAWWRNLIWLLLLLRLCVPIMIESPIGVVTSFNTIDTNPIQNINGNLESVNDTTTNMNEETPSTVVEAPAENIASTQNPKQTTNFSWLDIVNYTYILGLIVSISVFTIRILILNSKLSKFNKCRDRTILKLFRQIKKQLGIKRHISIIIETNGGIPALHGLLAPHIILPKSVLNSTNVKELEYIFIHELTHYKQRDIAKLWLLELATCIHWFNPLLHRIKAIIVQDIELNCDEKVLSIISNTEYASYSNVLVNFSTNKKSKAPLVVTSNFVGKRGSNLRERLIMIKKYNKTKIILIGLILVLAISTILVACTTLTGNNDNETDDAIRVRYQDYYSVNITEKFISPLIELLDKQELNQMDYDSIDENDYGEFEYFIINKNKGYNLYESKSEKNKFYLIYHNGNEKVLEPYTFNSDELSNLLDEIEEDTLATKDLVKYDIEIYEELKSIINGETKLKVIKSSVNWSFDDENQYRARAMFPAEDEYNEFHVFLTCQKSNLNRYLDYDYDYLKIYNADKDQFIENPTIEEFLEFTTMNVSEIETATQELSKIELIQKLNLMEVRDFSCGLAAARSDNGLCGFIDGQGNWVVEPLYNSVGDFNENIATVGYASERLINELNEEYELVGEEREDTAYLDEADTFGYVNINGDIVAEVKYGAANKFTNGYGLLSDQYEHIGYYVNYSGDVVLSSDTLPPELYGYDFWSGVNSDGTIFVGKTIEKDGSYQYYQSIIDLDGNLLLDGEKLNINFSGESVNGYRIAESNDKKDGFHDTGVIDSQGAWVIEPIYDEVKFIDDETLILTKVTDNGVGLESGISDINGQWIIEPNGKYIQNYGYGMYVFYTMTSPQKMELYNFNNQILLDGKSYQSIEVVGNDLVRTKDSDDTPYGLTWSDGTKVMSGYNTVNAQYLNDDIVAVYLQSDSKDYVGLIDYNNRENWLIEPKYSRLLSFEGAIGEGVIINHEKSDNDTFVFNVEKFDLLGNILSTSDELSMDYDSFQNFCPFFLR